ncbi:hypothetical protein [Puia dinghuensis]|uniref:Lipocalin-like domain-containing protein n=1 Tax=Puia dinghuensis TaxID=1792502 RepID=A0A8J2UGE8_9BACT|nr:hypothetical protein [Puia dinghuensis]GGB14000.1 hypothetical protein GCM10011511_42190 [Puia dinghuensis]
MLTKWTIFTLAAGFFITGCSSRVSSEKDLKVLTGSPWKYEKAGFDDDDGTFDALAPQIAGNERENTIIFCKDGTGYSEFAHRSKTGNPDSLPFIWAFQNDSTIYFQDQYYKVRVLTPQRLELYADQKFGGTSTRYTIILTR